MSERSVCPKCGAELPGETQPGLCVACQLAADLATGALNDASAQTIRLNLESPAAKPGDVIGRYKLLQQIGEGGCGVVYMAEQQEPIRRRVALKVIKPGMDTREVLARFEAERQALALMDHSNIAKVLDAESTDTGRPFFVMELVRGVPITRYCDDNKWDTRQRLELFILICRAIQHAHQKGIIHRDIKPSNILVGDDNGVPVLKIIDFGIAKATAGQRLTDKTVFTALEQFIGTPAYMSPEQARLSGLDVDSRSDIYSLGVLLYELLTGKTPFDAKKLLEAGLDEIRRIIREEDPPRPSQKLSTLAAAEQTTTARCRQTDSPHLINLVRGDLDWIVMKCLEKDRNRRYVTATSLMTEISRFLNNEPVIARPPGVWYRARKFARRHKVAFGAAFAILVLTPLTALLLVTAWPSHGPAVSRLLKNADASLLHYDMEGATAKAIGQLRTAKNIDPSNHEIWSKLGWAYWLLYEDNERDADRQDAFLCSSNSLALNTNNSEAHLVQGLFARDQRDWIVATNELLAAKALSRSGNPLVLVTLAFAYQDAGDPANAGHFSQLAENVTANQWQAFNRLGVFRQKTRDIEGARTNFEQAVHLAPKDPLPHRYLGEILLNEKLKRYSEARKELETSLRLRRTPQTLSALGSWYLASADYQNAERLFAEACQADPTRYIYPFNAGVALWLRPVTRPRSRFFFKQALEKLGGGLDVGGKKDLLRAYHGACFAGLQQEAEARNDLEAAYKEAHGDLQILNVVWVGYRLMGDNKRADEIAALQGRN